jgi:hypothetical protein
LFLALLGTLLTLLGAFYKILKDCGESLAAKQETKMDGVAAQIDAQQVYMGVRFTSVDNQLKFLLEHFVDHNQRIASLAIKTRNL